MKKLILNPELLRVESFPTTPLPGAMRGTVRGHDDTMESEWCTTPEGCSCPPCDTKEWSCDTC